MNPPSLLEPFRVSQQTAWVMLGVCLASACVGPVRTESKVDPEPGTVHLIGDPPPECGTAGTCLRFRNELRSPFVVTSLLVVLDGKIVWQRPGRDLTATGVCWFGDLSQGDHTVQLVLKLRGDGDGAFGYLRSYKFDVRSSHLFTAPTPGQSLNVEIIAFMRGTSSTPLEQRPSVKFVERVSL